MEAKDIILAIDQSTAGTKAMLFDKAGALIARCDREHRQLVDERGWVEHDPQEIYKNVIAMAAQVIKNAGVDPRRVAAAGISNQRETAMAWTQDGTPLYNAIVWQCGRGQALCERIAAKEQAQLVKEHTGLTLSPYFSAAKLGWIMENVEEAQKAARAGTLRCGTMDSYLIARLCGGHKTDYSNASRTQLFNIHTLAWDEEVCALFGVPASSLATVCDSDSEFGTTTFEGLFDAPIPVRGVMGDSHAALFAQGCHSPGMAKVTYGTGSSVMLNTGDTCASSPLLSVSLAWGMQGRVSYVLEGNINYTGAILKWLQTELELIDSPSQAAGIAQSVPDTGGVYLVPAFSGLSAPHWDGDARAAILGMSRATRKAHIVRAAEEAIAYQIRDVVEAMEKGPVPMSVLRADGGATGVAFMMQLQSDILGKSLEVSAMEELSGAGAAFAAGLSIGLYTEQTLKGCRNVRTYHPQMQKEQADTLYAGWLRAVDRIKTTHENA